MFKAFPYTGADRTLTYKTLEIAWKLFSWITLDFVP